MNFILRPLLVLIASSFLVNCSSHYKKRQEQREKVSAASGMFCEFVSGDEYPDIDVEMTFRLARRCDVSRPINMTNYRNASDNFGIFYCCKVGKLESRRLEKVLEKPGAPQPVAPPPEAAPQPAAPQPAAPQPEESN